MTSFQESLGGRTFYFSADRSTFSRKELDAGSRILVESCLHAQVFPHTGKILDFGCGWGPIGTILQAFHPGLELVFSDTNERALALAKANFARNLPDATAQFYLSDGLAAVPGCFDAIVFNPPIRAGKATVYRLYDEAYAALREGGSLWIVIRKQQGAASSKQKLAQLFGAGQPQVVERSKGYHVLLAQRQATTGDERNVE